MIEHVDVFLVAKRDRIARDMTHTGMVERMIEKHDAQLVSASGEGTQTDDSEGYLQRKADAVADEQRKQTYSVSDAADLFDVDSE